MFGMLNYFNQRLKSKADRNGFRPLRSSVSEFEFKTISGSGRKERNQKMPKFYSQYEISDGSDRVDKKVRVLYYCITKLLFFVKSKIRSFLKIFKDINLS